MALAVGACWSTPLLANTVGKWDECRFARGGNSLGSYSYMIIRDMGILLLLALSAINIAAGAYNPFIYFRF